MLNRIILAGRLVADPELRHTSNKVPVTSFRIANDRDFSKGGEKETDFLDIVAWRSSAEFICKYFTKGRMILVDGRLQTRERTTKDGTKWTGYEIVADNAYFGDSKRSEGGGDSVEAPMSGQYVGSFGTYQGPIPDSDFAPDI